MWLANALGDTIPPTDANFLTGSTLNDWVTKPDSVNSTVSGASFKVGFTGTRQVELQVDTTQLASVAAARYPFIAWSVNGGEILNRQLQPGDTSVLLASGVPDPVIDFYIQGMSPFEDRYDGDVPVNSVKLNGFTVDTGGSTVPLGLATNIWLNIGDSIMSGDAALFDAGLGRPGDDYWAGSTGGRASYGYLLAQRYGYREVRLAYGGYDWGGGLANVPALSTLIDQKTSTISRLSGGLLSPMPGVVLINLGENGAPALSDVTNALFKLRSRVVPATKIIVMVPVAGTSRTAVTDAFMTYSSQSGDTNAYLVDLGSITYPTADGQHPTALGHKDIYNAAAPYFDAIVGNSIVPAPQFATSASGFDSSIAVNLVRAGQSSLSSVSVSHGPSIATAFTTAGLNDGSAVANPNLTYYGNTDPTGGNLPVTVTFNLATNTGVSGYNVTNIQVLSGWTDSNLANQEFQLLLSVAGGPFLSYGTFAATTNTTALNNGNNAILQSLTSSVGLIAGNVTGVQFVFTNPGGAQGGSGGTLVREIQVFGAPVAATPPNLIQTTQTSASVSGLDGAIAPNLVRAGQSSLSQVVATHNSTSSGSFPLTGLNDGSAAANANYTYFAVNGASGNLPVTLTFYLNNTNTSGYNVTNIQVLSGWTDSNLANQKFHLLLAVAGGPFVDYGLFAASTNTTSLNNGQNSILTSLTGNSGLVASNVTAVQFVFVNPGGTQAGNGGTLIREIQVFGTPVASDATTLLDTIQLGASVSALDGAIAPNLIRSGQNSLSSMVASHGSSISSTFALAGVNDGSATAGTNLGYFGNIETSGGNLPMTFTFNLNTNGQTGGAPAGYVITNVQAISGWTDSYLANQCFQLLLSMSGGPFLDYGTYSAVNTLNAGGNSLMQSLTGTSGVIASNVTAVRFVFSPPGGSQGGSGGTLIRELQVFGSSAGLGGQVSSVAFTNGVASVSFAGLPGSKYHVQVSTDLHAWNDVWVTNAPADGFFLFDDNSPPLPAAYYRLMWNGN